jgi:UPF0042 nucleotide-binding protein
VDLIVISGRSGSGKSTALHQLEDEGYFAIDNLPPSLLPALVQESGPGLARHFRGIAVCIDARNAWRDLEQFPAILGALPDSVQRRVLYLDADEATLMRRFSETRRRHPLSSESLSLAEAIRREQELLEPVAASATLTLDTRAMTIYELRDAIRQRVVGATAEALTVLVQSFGFKRGIPGDADLVFDLRMLPNPHWSDALREQSGLDADVRRVPGAACGHRGTVRRYRRLRRRAGCPPTNQQPQLPDRGPRLHRRAASLRVHGGATARAPRGRARLQLQLRHRELQ